MAMTKASQIRQARGAAPAPAKPSRPAPAQGNATRQPPNPSQLLADAYDALRLAEDGMAAYSALQNLIAPGGGDPSKPVPAAPRFEWQAAMPGSNPRSVVTNLAKLDPDSRVAVLEPLINLHFDQMLAGARKAAAATNTLLQLLEQSAAAADAPQDGEGTPEEDDQTDAQDDNLALEDVDEDDATDDQGE